MALSPLPPTSDFVTTGETKGTFKAALSGLRAFLNSLLGNTGAQSDALTGLGALLNGSVAVSAAGTTVGVTHRGKLIDCTGTGGWTLAVDAVATLGAGFAFGVRNSSSGTITLDPDLGELIDGVTTLDLGPGESCLVQVNSDATALKTVGRTIAPPGAVLATTTKTSGTSHTLNAKTTHVVVEMVGGGGGGAGRNPGSATGGGGGGAGCYVRTLLLPTGGAGSLTYAVGGGGSGGGDNANGGGGGNSSITINGTTYTAYGGGGGISSSGSSGANGSKIQSANAISIPGTFGAPASGPAGGYGGASIFSGYVAQNTAGAVGGGGGGAYYSAPAAGTGGTGQVIITEYML